MATYILRITTRSEGRRANTRGPEPHPQHRGRDGLSGRAHNRAVRRVGDIDFVGILEADDNATAARFTLELGVKAGVRTVTLPAIPIGRLEDTSRDRPQEQSAYTVIGAGAGAGTGAS